MLQSPLRFSHEIINQALVSGDTVIDATVGNGNDTVVLAKAVGNMGKVYGFDIQEEAIKKTTDKLLLTGLLPQTELILEGHENIEKYVPEDADLGAVVFNLGYLPSGDKSIITQPDTTLKAIQQSLTRLRRGGILSLMIYYGHDGGKEEKAAVDELVVNLNQEEFQVLKYQFVNQRNNPPYLYLIEKR